MVLICLADSCSLYLLEEVSVYLSIHYLSIYGMILFVILFVILLWVYSRPSSIQARRREEKRREARSLFFRYWIISCVALRPHPSLLFPSLRSFLSSLGNQSCCLLARRERHVMPLARYRIPRIGGVWSYTLFVLFVFVGRKAAPFFTIPVYPSRAAVRDTIDVYFDILERVENATDLEKKRKEKKIKGCVR